MGSLRSKRERQLQAKLIPYNIVVCLISLVAALSLFLGPILKIDVGKILRDEGTMTFVEDTIGDALGGDLEDSDQGGIDYKPVVAMLVKNILGKAEGEISISAVSGLRVLTAGDNKAQRALNDLLFGDKALATKLINSIVDGIADMFETNEGKQVLEEAIVSTLASQIINNVDDKEVAEAVAKGVKDIIDIFSELEDPANVPDGKVDQVVNKLVDKIDGLLGDDVYIDDNIRQEFINQVQEIYDGTLAELNEGEVVSIESIICVTISKNADLSGIDIGALFDGMFTDSEGQSSVHIKSVEGELEEGDVENPGNPGEGSEGEGSDRVIVTNYNDLLEQMGFDKEAKDNLKEKMRSTLNNELTKLIEENGIDEYIGYYGYVFFAMLPFIALWLILFLFSFFHILAQNKRVMAWYVKLFCWIPSIFWLALTLFPVIANKFFPDILNGEQGPIIKAALNGVSSLTWINGLCLVILWVISIFWAFPIKRKIRRERKYPDGSDEY